MQKSAFLIREPFSAYHARSREFLSSHALADFRRCPALYRRRKLGLIPERDSTAFIVGRAAHTLILEGRARYEAEYAIGGPINPKTGNPFGANTKAFCEWAERVGKPALDDSQAALVEQMAASVREHAEAQSLLSEGVAEGVIRTRFNGFDCQARIDWYNDARNRLIDLKTCDSLDSFEQDFHRYEYGHQLAFYRDLLALRADIRAEVDVIAVEKREPFRCGVWSIHPALIHECGLENMAALDELAQCTASGVWPTRFEERRTMTNQTRRTEP